jgi:hypothetical protein
MTPTMVCMILRFDSKPLTATPRRGSQGERETTQTRQEIQEACRKNESTSKAPRKSKSTNQAEPETMHQVEMGIEGESELLLSGTSAGDATYHGYIVLCESKPPPRKRKAPVETAQDEPPKKKAKKSPTKELFDCDLALPSLPGSTVPCTTGSLQGQRSIVPRCREFSSQAKCCGTFGRHRTTSTKRKQTSQKVVISCGDENTPEAELTIEKKVTESGKKKRKSKNVPVVDSEDDTADADASAAVPHRDERALTPPFKHKPVIELTKRRSKKKVVQSDEEMDLAE